MIKNIVLAAAFFVGSSTAVFAQATMPAPVAPAPVNPLQQRVVPAAPAVTSPAPMAAPAPAPATKSAEAKPAKGAGAMRKKQCSAEYQTAKKANTLAGQTWPKFYSACNTRLKAAGQ
jgi:hypothetical protein